MILGTCYINYTLDGITTNRKLATKHRFLPGKRHFIYAREAKPNKEAAIKVGFSQSLYDAIANDVMNGEDGGSYFLDGSSPYYGYSVGGANTGTRPAGCVVITEEEATDRGDIIAAIELMAEEVDKVMTAFPDHPVMIGFWRYAGEVYFDASSWLTDEQEAAEMAFKTNNEWAYYDLTNGVELYLKDYLLKENMTLDEFVDTGKAASAWVRFKVSTKAYREADRDTQMNAKLAWFLGRF